MNDPHQQSTADLIGQAMRDFSAKLEPIPHDPLACPDVFRILLSAAASAVLRASGEDCFVIVGRASYPVDPARMVISLRPAPLKLVCEAEGVLRGSHSARRVKRPATATPDGKNKVPASTLPPPPCEAPPAV